MVADLPAPDAYLPWLTEMHERGWYSNFGPLARRFENRLSSIFGAAGETCVTASSATSGLSAALLATGRTGPVLVPAFTFPASLGAVRAAGMRPIIVDVDRESWAVNCDRLDEALTVTGATIVMLVAPFGLRRSFEAEIRLCQRRGAAVVIDNAAGLGVPRAACGLEEDVIEVFSMHATKPLGIGEGGAIFAHRSHEESLRAALNFALTTYQNSQPRWGFNGKLSEFHAAVGLAQLDRFEGMISKRQAFAGGYVERLAKHGDLIFPRDIGNAPWQCFPILLPNRMAVEGFVGAAAEVGVEIRRYYRPSLSRWPETATCGACPVAEDLADRMCVLPVRAQMPGADSDALAEIVVRALDSVLALSH